MAEKKNALDQLKDLIQNPPKGKEKTTTIFANPFAQSWGPPEMTTAQRNNFKTKAGHIIFNKDTKQWEGFNGVEWKPFKGG